MLSILFQSTLPREERQCAKTSCTTNKSYFNPRSHERSDYILLNQHTSQIISIHAPTRGATTMTLKDTVEMIFQSTLPREERQILILFNGFECLFQSTLPREERQRSNNLTILLHNFNPRSHERSDSNIAQKICLFLYNTDNKYIIR